MYQQKSLVVGLLAAIGIGSAGQEVHYQVDRQANVQLEPVDRFNPEELIQCLLKLAAARRCVSS
jgi:hypothetical protein